MTLDDILKRERSKWMEASGPAADIAISSRVRLARNLRQFPFPTRATSEQLREAARLLATAVPALSKALDRALHVVHLDQVSALDRQVLVEKHLISPALAKRDVGAVILSEDEAVSVMINEEDHVRIQCLMPGLQLEEAWKLADRIDDVLQEQFEFAYDVERGFLTTCPTNVGTGMRVSVMLHLPGLVLSDQISALFGTLAKVGVVARGLYGEGSQAQGNLFQISNQVTLGRSEQEMIEGVQSIAQQLIQRERSARERLYKQHKLRLEDRASRAYGLLTTARVMSSSEALQLLSDLRLGIDLSIIPHVSPQVFNDLIVAARPGFLQKVAGGTLTPEERDERRAALIRQRLQAGASPHQA